MSRFFAPSKHRARFAIAAALALALLSGCGRAARKTSARSAIPPPPAATGTTETGIASWYGKPYHGRQTASGEIYDMEKFTAAHRTLPFQTWLEVTNLSNGKHTDVRITDRGPFVDGRIIDLSLAAAREIDMVRSGTARVRLTVIPPPKDSVSKSRVPEAASLAAAASEGDPPEPSPAPIVAVTSVPPAPPPPRGYAVQAGAFVDRSRAETLRDLLASQLGTPDAVRVVEGPTGSLWRVVAGRGLTMADAVALAPRVREIAGGALIVPDNDATDPAVRETPDAESPTR